MSRWTIWQVRESHLREYGFLSLEAIRRDNPTAFGLPREAWEPVYVFETDASLSLDWIFTHFNRGAWDVPADYTGRSMSVSDIVERPDGKLWFCDSRGWQRVRWARDETEPSGRARPSPTDAGTGET